MTTLNKGQVAFADDEENLRETVLYALRKEGYEAIGYADGSAAWDGLQAAPADVVILDILMPRMDGLELCRRLRACSESLPILFLSSRDEELDRVLGLELGADDYLCKPFSMRELIARVRVLFRRLALGRPKDGDKGADKGGEKARKHRGEAARDRRAWCSTSQRYLVSWKGAPVQLTLTEFLILQALDPPSRPRQDPPAAARRRLRLRYLRQRPHHRLPHQEAAPQAGRVRPAVRRDRNGLRARLPLAPGLSARVREAGSGPPAALAALFSRIGVRLLAFNLLIVFGPAVGFLSLETFESTLLLWQERAMVQQGRLLAAALAGSSRMLDVPAAEADPAQHGTPFRSPACG